MGRLTASRAGSPQICRKTKAEKVSRGKGSWRSQGGHPRPWPARLASHFLLPCRWLPRDQSGHTLLKWLAQNRDMN